MVLIFAGFLILFVSVAFLVYTLVPIAMERSAQISQQNAAKLALKYDAILTQDQMKKSQQMTLIVPLAIAGLAIVFAPADLRPAAIALALVLGVMAPRFYLNFLTEQRKRKFDDQIIDALMIMSSSFRGGLSLIQAFESVVEEMPDPIRQEFGIVLGENKMGVSLEDSLNRLHKRMPSAAVQQMVTAILLARETGGNLALIFSRIIATKRERRKIEQNLKTLTIQGKIQSAVMTGLPVLFYFGVSGSNPHFFDVMKNSPQGQQLLMACGVLWVLGALSIWKISTFKDL